METHQTAPTLSKIIITFHDRRLPLVEPRDDVSNGALELAREFLLITIVVTSGPRLLLIVSPSPGASLVIAAAAAAAAVADVVDGAAGVPTAAIDGTGVGTPDIAVVAAAVVFLLLNI